MVFEKLPGECPVEAFDVSVHLRRTRVRVVLSDVETFTCFPESKSELRSVVRLHFLDRSGRYLFQLREKVCSGLRRMGRICSCECEPWFNVDRSVDVSLDAVHETDHGIDLDTTLLSFGTPDFPAIYSLSFENVAGASRDRHLPICRQSSLFFEISETSSDE